jgi:Golgi SNAP receptor complex protein 1
MIRYASLSSSSVRQSLIIVVVIFLQQLLRERNAIDNSMNSASSVLNQAAYVRAELRNQGANLRGITRTMGRIASNVPGLNTIIDKIRKKRLQDDRVMGGVVAMCILFTLWYLFG